MNDSIPVPSADVQTNTPTISYVCDDKPRAILTALNEPLSIAALIERTGIPRSTLYRFLERLANDGLVVSENEFYQRSEAGSSQLLTSKVFNDGRPLERLWTWLRELPTELHRSTLILAFFILSARRSNCVDDRHPGLILLGSTQLLKSWLCKILCLLAGSNPDSCRVPMQQVRQRGLLVRLDGKGEIAYLSEQLKEPFLWLEEFSLAEPGVLRDVTALMQGSKTIRIENQQIEVASVPLIEMNPVKNSEDLGDRLGLRPERIRRNFVANFSAVKVTRAMRASAGEVAEKLKSVGAIVIPTAPSTSLAKESLALIEDVVASLVLPTKIDFVDPSRIQTAVLGARAWLSEGNAIAETLWCWGELAESTNFLVKNWRACLASLLAPSKPMVVPPKQPPMIALATSITKKNQEEGSNMNRYILNDVLLELKALLNAAGLRVPEDCSTIKTMLKVISRVTQNGVLPKRLMTDPEAWFRLQKLQQFLDAEKLSISDLERLLDCFSESGFNVARPHAAILVWAPQPVRKVVEPRKLHVFHQLHSYILQGPPSAQEAEDLVQWLENCYLNLHASYSEAVEDNAILRAEIQRLNCAAATSPDSQKLTPTSAPTSRA